MPNFQASVCWGSGLCYGLDGDGAPGTQHKRNMAGQSINEFNDGSQIPNLEGAGSNPAGVTTVS
jgi:hypothetical protein